MSPNAGNPQKVQRYPWTWAEVLAEMSGIGAGTLRPGRGPPIEGEEDVREALLDSAAYLHALVEETIEALNDGSPPHVDVLHTVEYPEPDEPYLRELYDESESVVRNVVRYFGGWWTSRPSELKPAPRAAVAEGMAALAGGAGELADRALELLDDEGDGRNRHDGQNHYNDRDRLALHVADHALEAAPDDETVRERVAERYERRAERVGSSMASDIYRSAVAYAEAGRPFRRNDAGGRPPVRHRFETVLPVSPVPS
jgi:alkyl sulfatase BDS1-like metallo-beta-lactamase superfamily hydrolase